MQRHLPVLVAAAFLVSGCTTLDSLSERGQFGSAVEDTLVFQDRLATAPTEELAAIGRRLRPDGGQNALNPVDSLRYALWQATPGHPDHDPAAAERRLVRLLDESSPPRAMEALIHAQLRHLRAQQSMHQELNAELILRTGRQQAVNEELRAKIERQEREIERLQQQIEELTRLERRMGSSSDDDSRQ